MPRKRESNPYRVQLADGSAIERRYHTDSDGRQEPYGNWKWEVYDPTRRPAKKKINLYTKDKRSAMRKANELVTLRATGAFDPWTDAAPREGVTIAEAVEHYLAAKGRSGRSPATIQTDRGHLNRLERALPPGFLVQHVEARHVEAFLSRPSKRGEPPSDAYRHRVRATLLHFFGWALEAGLTRANPAAAVKPPKASDARREHVTEAELRAIIGAIEASEAETGKDRAWLKDWVVFGFGTGLRPGEQRQLKWGAVSLEERHIHVGKGHRTKTAKSNRIVPVRGEALTVLKRRAAARASAEAPGGSDDRDGFVFTGKGGAPISTAYVTKQLKKFAEAADVPKNVVDYSLRHGYGTLMAQRGTPLWHLAKLMGTSVRMIEKHYGHYDPAHGAEHVDRVFGSD